MLHRYPPRSSIRLGSGVLLIGFRCGTRRKGIGLRMGPGATPARACPLGNRLGLRPERFPYAAPWPAVSCPQRAIRTAHAKGGRVRQGSSPARRGRIRTDSFTSQGCVGTARPPLSGSAPIPPAHALLPRQAAFRFNAAHTILVAGANCIFCKVIARNSLDVRFPCPVQLALRRGWGLVGVGRRESPA